MVNQSRNEMISFLSEKAPLIIEVIGTLDLGYEFTAITKQGVIFSSPGMLLGTTGGIWPPDNWPENWIDKSKDEINLLLNQFFNHEYKEVTKWDEISDLDLENIFNDVQNL